MNDHTVAHPAESTGAVGPVVLLQRAGAALDAAIAQVGLDPRAALDDLVAARLLLSAVLTTMPDEGAALEGVSP